MSEASPLLKPIQRPDFNEGGKKTQSNQTKPEQNNTEQNKVFKTKF